MLKLPVFASLHILMLLADSGLFLDFLYQGGVKPTVSGVFEDLQFEISEGYLQPKLRQPTGQRQESAVGMAKPISNL